MKFCWMTLSLIIAPAMGQTYSVSGSILLGGNGAWDYLRANNNSRSHNGGDSRGGLISLDTDASKARPHR
jgi:hypothetical protein